MITGFNTDIVFQGVTYHVQTEDKGVSTPLILSLVYDRGTILASKRSPYDDLLKGDFNEKELTERLQRQHKLICAAVRAGRIEDLRQMTAKESAAKQKVSAAAKEAKPVIENKPLQSEKLEKKQAPEPEKKTDEIPLPQILSTTATTSGKVQAVENFSGNPPEKAEVKTLAEDVLEIPISVLEDLIIEDVQIVEEEMILPAEVIEVVADTAKNEPADEGLRIELLNDVTFKSGERKTLSVKVGRGNAENGLGGAHVLVKILGSSFRPLIFHAKTDSNGVAIVHLQLPQFSRGRAAILVRAMSGGEETELRRVITHE